MRGLPSSCGAVKLETLCHPFSRPKIDMMTTTNANQERPRDSDISTQDTSPVLIGLGSNLADPLKQLNQAVARLRSAPEFDHVRVSSFHWTAPVGPVLDQPDFLNGAVAATTGHTPLEVLVRLQEIERAMGLDRAQKAFQGPRCIDLDLLFHGTSVISDDDLCVPHPRLVSRHFVLAPLMELVPDFIHPVTQRTVRSHYADLELDHER